jgi:hypothetical protein
MGHSTLALATLLAVAPSCARDNHNAPVAMSSDPSSYPTSAASSLIDGSDSPPLPALRVLFIGNSYTFVNDLPSMTRSMVTASRHVSSIAVDSVVVGGATLKNLWDAGEAATRVHAGGWTHVVIQGQSVEPCVDPETYADYAARFATEARSVGASPLIYGTWPHDFGDPIFSGAWATKTPTFLEACLETGFTAAVARNAGALVDVGEAWMRVVAARPDLTLWQPDHSHPTVAGTFLAASKFVAALTGASAVGVDFHPAGLSSADAAWIEQMAGGR